MINWNKSDDGYVTSKCGRFEIEPYFASRTKAIGYNVYYRHSADAVREKLRYYAVTQSDAKRVAARHLRKEEALIAAYLAKISKQDADNGIE